MRKLAEPGVNSARFDYYLPPAIKAMLKMVAKHEGRPMSSVLNQMIERKHQVYGLAEPTPEMIEMMRQKKDRMVEEEVEQQSA